MVAKARLRPMQGLKAPRIRRVKLSARVAQPPADTATTPLSQRSPTTNSCQSPSTISPSSSRRIAGQPIPAGPAWSMFGPHATGAERFATVSNGTPLAQVAGAILREQARVQNPDKPRCRPAGGARSSVKIGVVAHQRRMSLVVGGRC
jgi:hypothetical protein